MLELVSVGFIERVASTSPKVGIGFLEAFAEYLCERLKEESYKSFTDFWKAHEEGTGYLARVEGRPVQVSEGFFVLNECPFAKTLVSYKEKFGELPACFPAIVNGYREDHEEAVIISPFCILHQKFRQLYLDKVKCKDKKPKHVQIACKSPITHEIATCAIKETEKLGIDPKQINTIMKLAYCCYAIK
jgi:hypothetical protein